MFISGNFFTILGRALAFLSGIVEFYIFDKLLAVPTARVARKLAPLAFSTGLSLLGALPPNPHPSLNVVSFPHSVLRSLIPSLSFTQSHSLTQFYAVSFPHSVLRSLIPSLSFTQSHFLTQFYAVSFPHSVLHSLMPSLSFMQSHALTQFYTVSSLHTVLFIQSHSLTHFMQSHSHIHFYAVSSQTHICTVSFPHSFYTVSFPYPFLRSLIIPLPIFMQSYLIHLYTISFGQSSLQSHPDNHPSLCSQQSHFNIHFYIVSSQCSFLCSLIPSPIFIQSHSSVYLYTVAIVVLQW
jgi:hypothetical protein